MQKQKKDLDSHPSRPDHAAELVLTSKATCMGGCCGSADVGSPGEPGRSCLLKCSEAGAACGSRDTKNMGNKKFRQSVATNVNATLWAGVTFRCTERLFSSFFTNIAGGELLLRRLHVESKTGAAAYGDLGTREVSCPPFEGGLFLCKNDNPFGIPAQWPG